MGKVDLNNTLIPKARPTLKPSKGAILSRDFSGCDSDGIWVTLPLGIKDEEGKVIRNVWLETLTGRDEQGVTGVGRDLSLPELVSGLLNSKVKLKGKSPPENLAVRLSVADRDMLILYLRMLTFGPEIRGFTECPHKGCGSKLDFTFDLTRIEIPFIKKGEDIYSASIDYQLKKTTFSYREPDGSDQEAISGLVNIEPYRALLELLSGCLIQVEGLSGISFKTLSELPQDVLLGMDKIIAEGMTSLDWDIELNCAECNKSFISTLDIQAFFYEELQFSKDDFWREVHQLAFYYHWSEADILSLTRWKRKMYLSHIQSHLMNTSMGYGV